MTYILNGKEMKYLNRLVLETVKLYIHEHPTINYKELKKVFKDNLQGSYGVIKNDEDLKSLANNTKDIEKRFFLKDNEIITLSNGEKIYVCTGWGDDYTNSNGKYKKGNKKPFIEFIKDLGYEIIIKDEKNSDIHESNKLYSSNTLNIKNIILYGAPGVGKTHNYKNIIAMIEEGRNQKEIFDTVSKNSHVDLNSDTFESIKKEKRVEFVTFHQSYSYEDFIEGFRPNESGNIELEDGIFKNIADEARKNLENSQKQIETIREE